VRADRGRSFHNPGTAAAQAVSFSQTKRQLGCVTAPRRGDNVVVLGLTGSIGMGKSTAARFFAEAGIPVHGADLTGPRLYAGPAAAIIEAEFPGVSNAEGVDRDKLVKQVLGDAEALRRLEEIIHPLVRCEEVRFLDEAERAGAPIAVLDIPLL